MAEVVVEIPQEAIDQDGYVDILSFAPEGYSGLVMDPDQGTVTFFVREATDHG